MTSDQAYEFQFFLPAGRTPFQYKYNGKVIATKGWRPQEA